MLSVSWSILVGSSHLAGYSSLRNIRKEDRPVTSTAIVWEHYGCPVSITGVQLSLQGSRNPWAKVNVTAAVWIANEAVSGTDYILKSHTWSAHAGLPPTECMLHTLHSGCRHILTASWVNARLYVRLFSVFAVILQTSCCDSWSLEHGVGFRRRGLLTGLTGDEWRSWVLQRHLWRTHIVASPGEKTEQSGNTGGISYCDVISHKTFSFSQMKQGGKEAKGGEAERQEEMEEGQKVDNKVRRRDPEEGTGMRDRRKRGSVCPSLLHNT